MVDILEYVDQDFIPLGNGSYRWLDLKRFRCDPAASDVALLSALIAHVRYQDHYATSDAHWEPTGNLHGPYWLDRISVDSFDAADALTARSVIRLWAEEYNGREARGFSTLTDRADAIIDSATSLWLLRNLRDDAQHDWGWVLGDFHEVVALDRPNSGLTLMVASLD